jgi:hypothetical protein
MVLSEGAVEAIHFVTPQEKYIPEMLQEANQAAVVVESELPVACQLDLLDGPQCLLLGYNRYTEGRVELNTHPVSRGAKGALFQDRHHGASRGSQPMPPLQELVGHLWA